MTVYEVVFKNGETLSFNSADGFRNRLDVYNYICLNRLGKKYGKVEEITCRVLPE